MIARMLLIYNYIYIYIYNYNRHDCYSIKHNISVIQFFSNIAYKGSV